MLRVNLLGQFQVMVDGRLLPIDRWRRRRTALLLQLLALSPGFRLHREQVFECLWPELDVTAARNNLNVTVHDLRRTLDVSAPGADLFVQRIGDAVALVPANRVEVDVVTFEDAISEAWRTGDSSMFWRAVDLFTGDLLPDHPFEEWIERRRSVLRSSYMTALSRLATLHEQQGDDDATMAVLVRLLEKDPLDEGATRSLMSLLARSGQSSRALRHYERLTEALERELGVEPEASTRDLYRQLLESPSSVPILHQTASPLDSSSDSPRTMPGALRTNLPAEIDALIGRDQEIAELQNLLSESRIITLTGPGGVGKTVLAVAAARAIAEDFSHVFRVLLDQVAEPRFVLPAIARALGLHEAPGQSTMDAIVGYVGNKRFLLLLDNFEQVVDAAVDLAHLLSRCPNLKVLVTSRVRLRLQGEHEFPVAPLSFPALGESVERIRDFPAVALFQTRMRQVRPDANFNQQQSFAISEICRRLDGLPLAIELAAVRCKAMSPEVLLARLERSLSVLTGGSRDSPDRQQSLRDTIAWSYQLLDPPEQLMLRQLSVCIGGWGLEAAEALNRDDMGNFRADDVLDLMFTLVDQSLVLAAEEPGGQPRFRMLETIREFGLEQLDAEGELSQVAERHAHYFGSFVDHAMSFMYGPQQAYWIDRMDEDHANILAALDWFLENDAERGLQIIGPLWLPWWIRNHLSIGRHYYDAFLSAVAEETCDDVTYAHALTGAGIISEWQGETERAISLAQQALSVWLDLSHPPDGAYWAFICLGNLALNESDLSLAEHWYKQGLEFAQRHGHEYGVSALLDCLARVASIQGQFARAESLILTSLAEARKRGDPWSIGLSTGNLGFMLMTLGRHQEARPLIEEGLESAKRLGLDRYRVEVQINLAILHAYLGQPERGEALLNESLDIAIDTGDFDGLSRAKLGLAIVAHRRGEISDAERLYIESIDQTSLALDLTTVPSSIDGLASVYVDLGQYERAVRFYSFAMAFREQTGITVSMHVQELMNASMTRARSILSPEAVEQAWSAGQAMTLDEIREELGINDDQLEQSRVTDRR